ncbi:hypothetical protein COCMIDRAFT_109575, partial [Bipolaris oryzae ATCC 44560]
RDDHSTRWDPQWFSNHSSSYPGRGSLLLLLVTRCYYAIVSLVRAEDRCT